MKRDRDPVRAIRFPDGEVLTGNSHTELALRGIEMGHGFYKKMDAGWLDYRGVFRPLKPKPNEVFVGTIGTPDGAIRRARDASWDQMYAAEELLEVERYDHDNLRVFIDEFKKLGSIELIPAIEGISGRVWACGTRHGEIRVRYPECMMERNTTGFVDLDGRFYNRAQAAQIQLQLTGHCTNKKNLVTGEEWIMKMETEADAIHQGRHFHRLGFNHACMRLNVYKTKGIHPNYRELLQIAIREYRNDKWNKA